MRRPGRSLFAALMACHGTELEPHARRVVGRIVLAEITNARIGIALGVSERHARRLLHRYGWTRVRTGRFDWQAVEPEARAA